MVKGSYLDCVNISNHIKNFFKEELFLRLIDESIEIIDSKLAKYLIFLGVRISLSFNKLNKPNNTEIRLEAPINYIKVKLTKAGFLKDQKPIPLLIWTSYEKIVILSLYHSIYKSIINYYSFVSNRRKLDTWLYRVLNSSCLKLLASKFSLSSQKKVIKRFGSNLINRPVYLPTRNENLIFFRAIIKRFNSSFSLGLHKISTTQLNLNAYIAGIIDAEGNFYIKVVKNSTYTTGYLVQLTFGLILHAKDLDLLKMIQAEFKGVGHIWEGKAGLDKGARVQYQISSIKDIKILINHLDKYPLLTQKWSDYQLFKQAWEIVVRKEHLTMEGLKNILSIKAAMNSNGLSDKLNKVFPDLIPMTRPVQGTQVPSYTIYNDNLTQKGFNNTRYMTQAD